VSPPLSGDANFVSPFVVAPSDPDAIYAATSYTARSNDAGSSWTTLNGGLELNGDPVLSMAVSHTNPNVCYAGTTPWDSPAEIFVTTNGGLSFQNITGGLPDRYPVDLAVDPDNDAMAYVAYAGFGSSHVFKTTNHGSSWLDIGAGLPDIPTSAVVVDPYRTQHVYVGNDLGVYVSTDAGSSWLLFHEGLPDACMIMDLSISPSNRKLRAATHGNGVYQRSLLSTLVAVKDGDPTPIDFQLNQNYPNPFNPSTTIRYTIPKTARVTLIVYNMLGQKVRSLVDLPAHPAGTRNVEWNGTDDIGRPVASGLYLYRLAFDRQAQVKKMLIIK
jgi:hypothetical protein